MSSNSNSHLSITLPLNLLEECFHVSLSTISLTNSDDTTSSIHPLFYFLWNEFCKSTESICHDLLLNISNHTYWRDVILTASLNPVSERWEQSVKMLIHASKMSCHVDYVIDILLLWRDNRLSHLLSSKSTTTKSYAFSSQTPLALNQLKESILYDIITLRVVLLLCESLQPEQLTNKLFSKILNVIIHNISKSADEQLHLKFSFVPSLYLSSKILSGLSVSHFQATIEAIFQQLSTVRSQSPLSTLLILSLRYVQLKVYPLECLDQTSYSLYQCCKYFDQQFTNKLDWAILLNHWIIRLIPLIHAEMNIPSISKPIDQLRERASKYASKAKATPESLELVSTLLCITRRDIFMKQFPITIDDLLSRIIKDKSTSIRQAAFISLSRLIWVYLYLHSQSSYSEVTSCLLSIIKRLYNPSDQYHTVHAPKRAVFYPPDLPNYFHIRLLGIIGYKCIELVCSEIGSSFLSSSLQFDTLFRIPLWISNIYDFVEQWFTMNHQNNAATPPLTTILQRDWQCFEYSHLVLCSFLYSLYSNVFSSLPPFPLESPLISPDYSYFHDYENGTRSYLDIGKEWADIGTFTQTSSVTEFLFKYDQYFVNNCPFTRQQAIDKCVRSLTELVLPLDKLLPTLIESSFFEEKHFSFLYQGTPGIQISQHRGSSVFKSMIIVDTLFGTPRHHHDRKSSTISLETHRLPPSPSESTLVSSTLKSSLLLPGTDTMKTSRTATPIGDVSPSTHPILEGTLEWISNLIGIIPLILYHYNMISKSSFHPMALSPTTQDSQIQLSRNKKLMLIKVVLLGCAFPHSSLIKQRAEASLKCIINTSQEYIPEVLAILDEWTDQSNFFIITERKATILSIYLLALSIIPSDFLKSDIKYKTLLLHRYLDTLISPLRVRKYSALFSEYLKVASLDSFVSILDDTIQHNDRHFTLCQCILEDDDMFWHRVLLPWILRKYIFLMDKYEILQPILTRISKNSLYRLIEGLNKLNPNGILSNKAKLFLSTRPVSDVSLNVSWRDSHSKMQRQEILLQLETDMIVSTILSSRVLESIAPELFISFFQFYHGRGTQGALFYSIGQAEGSHSHTTTTNILGGLQSNVPLSQLFSDLDFPNIYFIVPEAMRKRFFEYLSWIDSKWIKLFLHEWCYVFHLVGILSTHSDSTSLLKAPSFTANPPMILMLCDWMVLLTKCIESSLSCSSFLLPALSSIISILQHVDTHNRWESVQLKNHFNMITLRVLQNSISNIIVQSRPDLISKFFQYFLDHMCKPTIFSPNAKELSGTKEQRILITQHFDKLVQNMDETVLECLILLTKYHEIIKYHSSQITLTLKQPLRKAWTLTVHEEFEKRKPSVSTISQHSILSNHSITTIEEELLEMFSWMDPLWSSWIIPLICRQPLGGMRALSNYLSFSPRFPYDNRSWSELLHVIWSKLKELKDTSMSDRQYNIDSLHSIIVSICNAFQWNLDQLAPVLESIMDINHCWLNHHHFINRTSNVTLLGWIISWWHLFRSVRYTSKNHPSMRALLDVSQTGLALLSRLFIKLCESDMVIPIGSIFKVDMNEITLDKMLLDETIPPCLSTIFSLLYISETCKWIQYDQSHIHHNIDWDLVFKAVKSALNNSISLLPLLRHILYLSIITLSPWYIYQGDEKFDEIYHNMPQQAQQLSKQVTDVWKYIFDTLKEYRIGLLQFLLCHAISGDSKNIILCILMTYLHLYEDVRLSCQRDLLILSLRETKNIDINASGDHYCACYSPWNENEPGLAYLNNILVKPENISCSDLALNWLLISFNMWTNTSLLNPDLVFCLLHPRNTIPVFILSSLMSKISSVDAMNDLTNSTVSILRKYENINQPFLSFGLFCRCMSVLLDKKRVEKIHLDILPILVGILEFVIENPSKRAIDCISFLFKHSLSLLLLEYQSINIDSVSRTLPLYQIILVKSASILLDRVDICNIVIEYGYEWFWSVIGKSNDHGSGFDNTLISLIRKVLEADSDSSSMYLGIFHNKRILSMHLYCLLGIDKKEWVELLVELMRFFRRENTDLVKINAQIVLLIIGLSVLCYYKWEGRDVDSRLVEELEKLDVSNLTSGFIRTSERDDIVFQFVNLYRKIIRLSPQFIGSRDHDLLLCVLFVRYHMMEQGIGVGHYMFRGIMSSSVVHGDLPGSPASLRQIHMKNMIGPRMEGLCYFILRHLLDNKDQSCLEYLYMVDSVMVLQELEHIDALTWSKSIYATLYDQLCGINMYPSAESEVQFIATLERRIEYPCESISS